MDKEQIIGLILDDNPTVDEIIELIYQVHSGLSLEGILDSEREGIWEMDTYNIIQIIENRDLYDVEIDYHGTIEEMVKYHLCTLLDVNELIERDMYMYEDIIYQTLEYMTMDELMDIVMDV